MGKAIRVFWAWGILAAAGGAAGAAASPGAAGVRGLRWPEDTFAFANETVWSYRDGRVVGRADSDGEVDGERYTRRCFVMARAAVQFWKFARFEAGAAAVGDEELARRVREVARRAVWAEALPWGKRVVMPGHPGLRELSRARAGVLRANIGQGWPTYFRPGNFGIVLPPGRGAQERARAEIERMLAAGEPPIVWMANFPSLSVNHAVVVVGRAGRGGYRVYDPNLPDEAPVLEFAVGERTFRFPKTFYFAGGAVDARVVYRGMLR